MNNLSYSPYSHVYICDEDRYAMQYLSYVIKKAVDRGVVKEDDFYLHIILCNVVLTKSPQNKKLEPLMITFLL